MWSKLGRLSLYLGYAAALVVVFALSAYFAFNQFVRRGAMPAPDLIGLPLADAETLLLDQGLEMRWLEREDRFDELVPAGLVLQQSPSPGGVVKRGSRVKVILSRGQQLVEVPELAGLAAQAAQVNLAAVGLTLGRRGNVFNDRGTPGTVIYQSPPPGTEVDRSTSVDVLVSVDNPTQVFVMPDLVYRRDIEVRQFFRERGFRLGSIKYEPYEGVAEGVILRQYPQAGHPLRRDEPISLVVAANLEGRI